MAGSNIGRLNKLDDCCSKVYADAKITKSANLALKLFEESVKAKAPFNAVIIDTKFDEMEGKELCKLMRMVEQVQNAKNVRIMMMCEEVEVEEITGLLDKSKSVGFVDCLFNEPLSYH